MRILIIIALSSLLVSLTAGASGRELYNTSFEEFNLGELKQQAESEVIWKSKGKSEITSKFHHTGTRALHLQGGDENILELEIQDEAQNVKAINFMAERWTRNGPFKFRVQAKMGGQWKEISNLDRVIQTGARFRSNITLEIPEDTQVSGLRLVCTAPEGTGILLDDFRLLRDAPVEYHRSPGNYVSSATCDPVKPGLLPLPQQITWGDQTIELDSVKLTLPMQTGDAQRARRIAIELRQLLDTHRITTDDASTRRLTFQFGEVPVPGHWKGQEKEAYTLTADDEGIVVTANTESGLYYGLQTLRQLMVQKDGKTTVAACRIHDFPAFKIRGFMHDVGRNYQSIEQLKMQIDVMAMHKLNVFHWHITEYYGWRLESKLYPGLQSDKAFERWHGKYYTQEEFKEMVDYCWERGIIIIPEFDSPGHSDAFRRGLEIPNMKDPRAIEAMTALIDELCTLAGPERMPYIHIGTDEVRHPAEHVNGDYVPKLHEAVQRNSREVIGWAKGLTFRGAKQVSQTWARYNPFPGTKHIDSRSNYVNHLEALDFAPRMFFQQPCRQPHGDEINLGGILCYWPDTLTDNQARSLTNNPVIPAMVGYSEAVWKGIDKDRPEYWAKLPSKGSPEYEAYADFENRLAQVRDRFHTDVPFIMVKTHEIEWRLLGPVADGEIDELERGIIQDSYHSDAGPLNWTGPVYGGAIHLKHFFGFPSHLSSFPEGKNIVWANTHVYSPRDQEVGAWINFNTISSSDPRAGVAQQGDWGPNPACNIWLNGEQLEPPRWQNKGEAAKEIALIDEVYTSREPYKIKLKKGWNSVLIKSAPTWKWVFSFSPVEKNGQAYREVDGLKYSATGILNPVQAVEPPRVVGVPPADAGRGLIRVSENEIRHYPGKGGRTMLQSLDNGETWKSVPLPPGYPGATCLTKESPAIAKNPVTGEFIRFEPLYRGKNNNDGVYITEGGIDGTWKLVRDKDGNAVRPGGILRNPLWVNENRRIVLPGHGGGCWTWYSDDQGLSWRQSNIVNAPDHKPGGIHKGTRWNHGMVEGTVIELHNGTLWIIARTSQDQHYETFSRDFGKTWSEPQPSRFWGTITMPTLHRLNDGRILFLWSNTTPLPENEHATGRGEDAFTNRDTIHAAISEDDGKTWIGFRELILDEHRNRGDYGTFRGAQDRGKHQAEVVQLDENRVLFTCGQHAMHRRLMIMDLRWLYEKQRRSNLAQDGTRDWSTHQYIYKKVGHCAYNRTEGARVEGDGLRVLRVDDASLTNPNQGAVWNFPSGQTGKLDTRIRLEPGGAGIRIALTDRWFNACDPTVDQFANYVLQIDEKGMTPEGKLILPPGETRKLSIIWQEADQGGEAFLKIDDQMTTIRIPSQHNAANGISYVHFYNPADRTDSEGFTILSTDLQVK